MTISIDIQRMVAFKRNQWNREAEISFCNLATRDGVVFTNITYPTGLKMVKAEIKGYHKTEVPLRTAKILRANGYVVIG